MKKIVLGIAVALAAQLPLAHADQTDFLLQLDNEGVFYGKSESMENNGKIACTSLRQNVPIADVITHLRPFYDQVTSTLIVKSAVQNLCPDMSARLRDIPAG